MFATADFYSYALLGCMASLADLNRFNFNKKVKNFLFVTIFLVTHILLIRLKLCVGLILVLYLGTYMSYAIL